jgi:hypothetical protein
VAGAAPTGSRPLPVVVTQPRRPLPTFGFPPRSKPPVIGGVANRQGSFVVIRVLGAFRPPAGIALRAACTGTVVLTVSRPRGKRRGLGEATAGLSRACAYGKLLRVRRKRIGRATSLRLRVAFKGNAVVGPSSVTYRLPVR